MIDKKILSLICSKQRENIELAILLCDDFNKLLNVFNPIFKICMLSVINSVIQKDTFIKNKH